LRIGNPITRLELEKNKNTVVNQDALMVPTETGIAFSMNAGETWSEIRFDTQVLSTEVSGDTLLSGTSGDGAWRVYWTP